MEFEEFLIDDNSENDIEENIEGNATNSTGNNEGYEGEIRPYMFEPMAHENDSNNPEQVREHEITTVQRNSLQTTEW